MSRNFLTKGNGQTVAPPGLNLVNVGLCIFYITILPIIAISEILQCENDDQFIIHCGKSQRRLHLIEFVLYFVAGCLLAIGWGVGGDSLSGHPSAAGAEKRRWKRGGESRRGGSTTTPPHLTPPPLSSASVLPNNQLVAKKRGHLSCKAEAADSHSVF